MKTITLVAGALLVIFYWAFKAFSIAMSERNAGIAILVAVLVSVLLFFLDPIEGRYPRPAS